jgi:hypothetical protein
MDPTRQYGAASYTPVPDLDARLLAMRLGDPSSARQQARYPALTPLLLPKDLAPTATPSVQSLLRPSPSAGRYPATSIYSYIKKVYKKLIKNMNK